MSCWWKSSKLAAEVRKGFHHFYSQCELRVKPGANTSGCLPNRIRTKIPRKNTFDPAAEEMKRTQIYGHKN